MRSTSASSDQPAQEFERLLQEYRNTSTRHCCFSFTRRSKKPAFINLMNFIENSNDNTTAKLSMLVKVLECYIGLQRRKARGKDEAATTLSGCLNKQIKKIADVTISPRAREYAVKNNIKVVRNSNNVAYLGQEFNHGQLSRIHKLAINVADQYQCTPIAPHAEIRL